MNALYPGVIPAPRRVCRKRRAVATSVTPAALTLVAAEFLTDDGAYVFLTFDRAVSIAGLVGAAVRVEHQPLESIYDTVGAMMASANVVRIEMSVNEACPAGPDVLLTATAANGIVAVDDGAAWAGCTALELPFP